MTDADTGAIGGANASGGPVKTAESVVPNVATRSGEDQLSGFEEIWEDVAVASVSGPTLSLQVGADVGQTLTMSGFAMNGLALDIMDADVTVDPNRVIAKMDRALEYVNARRAEIGAQLNRIESTIANLATSAESLTASRSRIQDADYAVETAALTRAQILQQAGVAMIAQLTPRPGRSDQAFTSSAPTVGVLGEPGTLHPHNAKALTRGRLHHDPAFQAVYDLGAELLQACDLGRNVVRFDVYVNTALVMHALNLHDRLVGRGLEHAVVSASARMPGIDGSAQCRSPEAGGLVDVRSVAVDQQGAESGLVHLLSPMYRQTISELTEGATST